MNRILISMVFALIMSLSLTASASEIMKEPIPTVEYSADMVMESPSGTMNGKVYYALDGKERSEISDGPMQMIAITRPDKNVVWTLLPAIKAYMEYDLGKIDKKLGADDCGMYFSTPGEEILV